MGDIFGARSVNTQLVADHWSRAGFKVLLPDFLEGRGMSTKHLSLIIPHSKELDEREFADAATFEVIEQKRLGLVMPWVERYDGEAQRSQVDRFYQGLRADTSQGVKIFGVGFCWGGRWVLRLAKERKIDAAVSVHPSYTTADDIDAIKNVPTFIILGDRDDLLSPQQLAEYDSILKRNLGPVRARTKLYENATHGFALRGDDTVERDRKMKEDVIKVGIEFVKTVLQ